MILPKSYFRLLDLIYRQPGIRFGELAKKANISVQSAQERIKDLIDYGAIHEKTFTSGKKVLMRMYYPSLKNEGAKILFSVIEMEIMHNFLKDSRQLKSILKEIAEGMDEASCIVIFGSFARKEQTSESDIDLFLLMRSRTYDKEKLRKTAERAFAAFSHKAEIRLSTLKEFRNSPFFESVLKDHVVVKGFSEFISMIKLQKNFAGVS